MPNKLHTDSQKPVFEVINYVPSFQSSGDLEATTKTISATAEASGLANKDYSSAKTLAIPSDSRLAISSLTSRLSVTIDSDDGTHDLRCRVYVDAQDTDHLLFDVTCTTTGNQLAVQGLTASVKPVLFALLKDGAPHTFYFYFWSPGNHSPVISLVTFWEACGTTKVAAWGTPVWTFTTPVGCEVQIREFTYTVGSGTHSVVWTLNGQTDGNVGLFAVHETGAIEVIAAQFFAAMSWQLITPGGIIKELIYGNVATDLNFIYGLTIFIKRYE
jgi:hypothetical protein